MSEFPVEAIDRCENCLLGGLTNDKKFYMIGDFYTPDFKFCSLKCTLEYYEAYRCYNLFSYTKFRIREEGRERVVPHMRPGGYICSGCKMSINPQNIGHDPLAFSIPRFHVGLFDFCSIACALHDWKTSCPNFCITCGERTFHTTNDAYTVDPFCDFFCRSSNPKRCDSCHCTTDITYVHQVGLSESRNCSGCAYKYQSIIMFFLNVITMHRTLIPVHEGRISIAQFNKAHVVNIINKVQPTEAPTQVDPQYTYADDSKELEVDESQPIYTTPVVSPFSPQTMEHMRMVHNRNVLSNLLSQEKSMSNEEKEDGEIEKTPPPTPRYSALKCSEAFSDPAIREALERKEKESKEIKVWDVSEDETESK